MVSGLARELLFCCQFAGRYVDMTPRNLIVDKNGVGKFFDQEWEYVEAIQVGYMVFRALMTSIGEMKNVAHPLDQANSQALPLIMKIAESVGFSFSAQQIKDYMAFERTFQKCVVGEDLLSYEALYSAEEKEVGITLPKASPEKSNSKPTVFDCSIIIPVFNKVELTQQCLTHLANVTEGISYEVIIVDNNSLDSTGEFLQSLDGDVQIIRNSTNLGFAKGNNQGAQAARGRYLVFLNNDTIPKKDWLKSLVDEVTEHPDVAVVGSKLLYPDDTIQHAGVVFSRQLQMPYHLFNGVPESLPAVNTRKEFQVVTAACILVRKETFEQVGGFDEGFVNGFEDVDLCLRIRQMGKKVVYQPKSCLYHLESQTSGRKNHEDANAMRLFTRWEHQCLVDEDLVAHQSGYFIQQYVSEGKMKSRLTPINEVADPATWKRIVDLQQLLLGQQYQPLAQMAEYQKIRGLLDDVEKWPSDIGILEWVGSVCEILGCEQEAIQFWEKLLTIGDHPNARLGLARATLKNGNHDDAQRHLDVLKNVFTPRVEAWSLQGVLSMQRREYSEAKYEFEQALAFESANKKALMGLGMACLGLDQIAEAWSIFEKIVYADPDNFEAVRCLMQAGTASQRWESLARHLSRFIARNPADCNVRFALAGVQLRAGQSDQAKEHLTWLRLIKPDYEGLADLEKLLGTSQSPNNLVSTR
jgi:GT2 family glycosyltransferase/tetratricopeptide (TPR) repeat protein